MRHLQTKTTGKFSRSVAIMLAMLITVSMAAVAFTAANAPVVSALDGRGRVGVGTLANSKNAHWVDATYFDYLSDTERNGSWLYPIQAGTGFNGAQDNWYTFDAFNSYISSNSASGTYPLYFGNFCFTPGAYGNTAAEAGSKTHGGPFISKMRNLKNFSYIANNSNAIKKWTGSSYDNTYAVQGLAQSKLDSNGNILATGGGVMPYFNESDLTSKNYAKVIKSYFPFRQEPIKNTKGIKYSFHSDGQDNVFFNWSGSTPNTINYGQGNAYAVQDGLRYFMNNTSSSYGIFPFNNANSATAGSRSGNSYLDYGFGIKMEFDFKVPEDGVFNDGSVNGVPAEFTYYGDDDLWVYMSEVGSDGKTTGDSKLVLDLGGNHSQSSGKINFQTMTATADKTVTINSGNYDSNYIYIHDDYGWGFWDDGHQVNKTSVEHNDGGVSRRDVPCLQIYAWDSRDQNGQFYVPEWDDTLKMFKISLDKRGSGKPYASGVAESWAPRLRDMAGFLVTSVSGSAQIDNTRQTSNRGVNDYKGKVVYTSTDYVFDFNNAPIYETPTYTTNATKDLTTLGFSTVSGVKNPSKQYLNPSKTYRMTIFYMERGMIESNNHITYTLIPAENDLDVKNTVKTADINPGLLSVISNEKFHYTLTASDGQTTSADIKSGQTANFGGVFETGTKLSVSQTVSSKLKYSTEYIVRDMMSGAEIHRGQLTEDANGNMTDEFTLINGATGKDYDKAYIFVEFINTPYVAPMTVSKKIVNEKGDEVNADPVQISGTLLLDLGDGFKAYGLDYKVSGQTGTKQLSGGSFSFMSNQTVTIDGIPKGAEYKITETSAPAGLEVVSGSFEGTISENNSVAFVNKKSQLDATVKAIKTLDGKNYTGELFEFTLTELFGDGRSKTISEISDGKITFNPDKDDKFLVFSEADTYSYKLVETRITDNNYISDITTDSTVYYVDVVVAPNPDNDNKLEAKVLYKTSANANGEEEIPTFANSIKKGSATVEKYNQSEKALADTSFTLYKVTGETDNSLTDAKKVQTLTTGDNGKVTFSNLDIYEAGFKPNKGIAPKYQWYCIVESKSASGYSKNETKVYFQLPQTKDGVKYYDITYKYQNGKIFSPNTAGEGMQIFRTIGIMVSVFALLLLAAYIYRTKRYNAKYAK